MQRFVGWLDGSPAPQLHAQPEPQMFEGYRVLHRGYIANRPALIAESKNRGESLDEASDAELFAKAYRWWGEKLQSHVLGEYAVSVFDEPHARLFITHDSLGLAPLFYSREPDRFAFASHLEDLVLIIGIDQLDEEYIADYLATGTVISSRTPYANLRRLEPGHSLHWINRRLSVIKTWDIAQIEPLVLGSDEEYGERFRVLLSDGVNAALCSDGKVWSELSGGLDSSSVVSVAAHSGARGLEAISIVFDSSRSADESEWMKAVIESHSLPWHTINADDAKPFSELPQEFYAEPNSASPGAGLFRLYKALAESHGVRVILSGTGGDQVFCGSPKPYYLADFMPFQMNHLFAALADWKTRNPEERSLMYLCLRNVLQPSLRYFTHRSLTSADTQAPPWIHPGYHHDLRWKKRSDFQVAPRCRSVGHQYLAERILSIGFARNDWDQGADSFEFRNPLLYRPLVEFMIAIPWEQKLQPDQDRCLQRRALNGILPERIRQRKNKGEPNEAYFEGLRNGSPWTEFLLNRPRIVDRGYVDDHLWREAVNQARFGWTPTMRHFIAAATLEIWLRQLPNARNKTTFTGVPYR